MTNENLDPREPGDEVPESAAGSEAHASGPAPQGGEPAADDLTVEDMLNSEQSPEAQAADTAEAVEPENEYLEDLRRITAEYANYRKRTEDNRELDKHRVTASVVTGLLPVLDDLDRAEKHGDLAEGSAFATIAQKVRGTIDRLGVVSFGEAGEAFDPMRHEAITQVPSPGVTEPTVLEVFERGYRLGDVELRPAKVVVAVGADG